MAKPELIFINALVRLYSRYVEMGRLQLALQKQLATAKGDTEEWKSVKVRLEVGN